MSDSSAGGSTVSVESVEDRPGPRRHLAVDLGASGGRVALGTIEDGKLTVEILHRWPHLGVSVNGKLYWDVLSIWQEILRGLAKAGGNVESVGVNSWGVDYGLIDESGTLLDGIHHYRCGRNERAFAETTEKLGRDWIYKETGIQFMPFNTLYQLIAHKRDNPGLFGVADRLLMLPDLLHYWLSGEMANERTIASTTQFYDPQIGNWSEPLINAFDLPHSLVGTIENPGTILGEVSPAIASETGLKGTKVVLPGSHDTASAVAAVPAFGDDWAYVSSGTWSLVGVENTHPFVNAQALEESLTNEAGINGTTRLLKNVMGLWILQECRRAWSAESGADVSFDQLYAEAEAYETGDFMFQSFDPDASEFLAPGRDMPQRVRRWGGSPERGWIVRSILEGLARKTAEVVDSLEKVTGRTIRTIHIVGGGSQIDLLNRLIATYSRRRVVAGPVEATLMGNLLVQAEACGSIAKGSIRSVVRAGTTLKTYEP